MSERERLRELRQIEPKMLSVCIYAYKCRYDLLCISPVTNATLSRFVVAVLFSVIFRTFQQIFIRVYDLQQIVKKI